MTIVKGLAAVAQSERENSDEEFSRHLLRDHLIRQGKLGFECNVNENDPPDLIVTWSDGVQWGVEVTRSYLQVARPGSNKSIASATITESLRRFGEDLGEATVGIRKREHFLSLGPEPVDSLRGNVPNFDRRWRKRVGADMRRHIVAGETEILRQPGVYLKPGSLGNRWTVVVSPGVAEIGSAASVMMQRALEKTAELPTWNANFSERWLLLLNCYPLVDDTSHVEDVLQRLLDQLQNALQFDGVFWSGCPNRDLVPIRKSQRSRVVQARVGVVSFPVK